MKNNIKLIILGVCLIIATAIVMKFHYTDKYETQIAIIKLQHQKEISKLNDDINFAKKDTEAYKFISKETEKDLNIAKEDKQKIQNELETLKQQIAYSKEAEQKRISRGGVSTAPLTDFAIYTVDELNEWIKAQAPANSPFIGRADAFVEASRQSGLSTKYLIAHAALESTWGTSPIARLKNNYFGITAYNSDPFNSAKQFTSLDNGIIEGALWIKRHFIDKGRDTIHSMLYEGKYAQYDDGSPNTEWLLNITSIMTYNK